jgi:hypothetical protein
MLSGGTRSAESVAFLLGYETPSVLQEQLRTYAGRSVSETAEGGLGALLDEFRRRWAGKEWRLNPRRARRTAGGGASGSGDR